MMNLKSHYALALFQPLIPANVPFIVIKIENDLFVNENVQPFYLEKEQSSRVVMQLSRLETFRPHMQMGGTISMFLIPGPAQDELRNLVERTPTKEVSKYLVKL